CMINSYFFFQAGDVLRTFCLSRGLGDVYERQDSKLQAEKGLMELQDSTFKIAVIRPPMIYGKGSKGNYQMLSKLAHIMPVFPVVFNKRSMLHIDNLCEFIRLIIINQDEGIFFPQNREFVSTTEMVKQIAKVDGKKYILQNL
ncbi:hypothetical protein CG709_12810, partial [Lachnotalea glycerini]